MLFKTLLLLLFFHSAHAQSPTLTAADFKPLLGCWQGSLTYLDYKSGKPYTMPANLTVAQMGSTNSLSFANVYPNEQSANGTDTITLSAGGRQLNKETVKQKRKAKDGSLRIITEASGTDGNDNQPATFRFTYFIGKGEYWRKKEVRFTGTKKWTERHRYSYRRCR